MCYLGSCIFLFLAFSYSWRVVPRLNTSIFRILTKPFQIVKLDIFWVDSYQSSNLLEHQQNNAQPKRNQREARGEVEDQNPFGIDDYSRYEDHINWRQRRLPRARDGDVKVEVLEFDRKNARWCLFRLIIHCWNNFWI